MIHVKSFDSTRTSDGYTPVKNDISHVIEEATKEMQSWIDEQEGYIKIISTSTQLVANESFVAYVITVVTEQAG